MTKEEVLQKANDYCSEKGYTNETLTDGFKDKFADFFSKKYPEGDINDENIIADLKFNLNTAFSATSQGLTSKQKAFDEKVADFNRQIEELNKRISDADKKKTKTDKDKPQELPKELQEKLDRLEKFEDDARKREKFQEVLALAKKSVRTDLHKSLENYATDFAVNLEESSEGQAKKLTERFQAIFRDSIGDIKPLAPKQTNKQDVDALREMPKLKV